MLKTIAVVAEGQVYTVAAEDVISWYAFLNVSAIVISPN